VVARQCGLTRIADITGLDRIGMPVWQGVRPWGRSLSVHQGKGLDAAQARLGACMEAIECSHAESWRAPTNRCCFADLPKGQRAPAADDFASHRGAVGDSMTMDWVAAERLAAPGILWVPAVTVSLDFTQDAPFGIERSSNGQGAGFDAGFAGYKALCELIERDAFAAWATGNIVTRLADEIDLAGIAFGWFTTLHARCEVLGISVRAYRLPAIIAMPVIAVELHDASGEAASHPLATGTCAHADAETALRGALTEAIQARLTIIAGARDDLALDHPAARRPSFGFALARTAPAPLQFAALWPAVPRQPLQVALANALAALAAAGYQAARLILSPPGSPVVTVRMFVPGLGLGARARRAA
jgi:ribosomal protein S12 methylthiotransferase accessory factor